MQPLVEVAAELNGKTFYLRRASLESAPQYTDCLTSIHYLFKKALQVDIPLTFIGDMPRQLSSFGEWKVLKTQVHEALCGDLIFVKKRNMSQLISHVGMVTEENQIFHCSKEAQTAVIESWEAFFSQYEQQLDFVEMVRYIDPRNKALREEHKGKYIKA